MKRTILITLMICYSIVSFSQDTLIESKKIIVYDTVFVKQTIKVVDTLIQNETKVITFDTINQIIQHSEYNALMEKTLDQKQKFYDSALNRLEWVNSIIGVLITIIIFVIGFLGFNSINNIKKNLISELSDEVKLIDEKINRKAKDITTLRYDKDIQDINEKLLNLERFANDSANSFSVKRGKTKPEYTQQIEVPKSTKNPFDKK